MEENKNQSFVDRIWNLFSSVTLAVVLIALIALTSIVGTLIEQNVEPEKNLRLLAKLFGTSLAPALYNTFEKLGFMDMYHSWWFVGLLMLFSANLLICSIERLPRIWKLVKEPVKPLTDEQLKNLGKKEIVLKGKSNKTRDAVLSAVTAAGFKPLEIKESNGYQFYAEKGNYTRLGIYITHFSILLILIGALIGIFFGFKGFLNLPEGKTYSVAFERTRVMNPAEENEMEALIDVLQHTEGNVQIAAKQIMIDEKTFNTKLKRYGIFPLGFGIRCDNFQVDFYGRSSMPKEYKSWLTVIKDGRVVPGFDKKTIEVNGPLTYNGITFYQSSYGMVPGAHGEFILRIASNAGAAETKQLHLKDRFNIPGTNMQGTLLDFSPALSFDEMGRHFTSSEQMNNPAVYIEFSENGKTKYAGWLMKRHPETWNLPDGNTVEFADIWGVEYTGLQVRRDPGVGVVYFGCLAMAAGLYIAFFMSHKKIWVRLVEEKNSSRVIIALTANKNRQALEKKIDKMVALLSKTEGGGKK